MPVPVKLQLDDEGKAIIEDGLPVFEFDDGSVSPVDIGNSFKSYEKKISNFDEERDRVSAKLKETQSALRKFKDLDIDKYNEGMKKIEAIKDQKLLDEHGAETLKKSMRALFDEELAGVHNGYKKNINEYEEKLNNQNKIIYDLAIKNKFATDKHFAGDSPVTIYNPEDAAKIYGDHFNVEISGDKYEIVAKDHKGNPILSRKNTGEPAEFSEAISHIIQVESKNKPILRNAKTGGPVTSSNLNTGDDPDFSKKSSTEKIKAGLLQYRRQI